MRICSLIAGTGSFICGTSNRDLVLARGLSEAGHEVRTLPLYLPVATDERDEINAPIFLGGINAFLQQHCPLCRRSPRWCDAWLDRPGLLRLASGLSDLTRARGMGPMTLSILDGRQGRQAKEVTRLLAWLERQPRFDLVLLSNLMFTGLAEAIRSTLKVPVVCLMGGEDGFLDALGEPWTAQAWQQVSRHAAWVDAYIGVSRFFVQGMTSRGLLPGGKVHVVHPGLVLDGYAPAPTPPPQPTLGYLAHLIPLKGLHLVIDAAARLRQGRHSTLRLQVAGTRNLAERAWVIRERRRASSLGLDATWAYDISKTAKQAFLRQCTVFSVIPTYAEAFGLYCLEALASGVPIVVPARGALPEVLEATGGGLCYTPPADGDRHAESAILADTLHTLLTDTSRCRRLAEAGHTAVTQRYHHRRMAAEHLAIFEHLR